MHKEVSHVRVVVTSRRSLCSVFCFNFALLGIIMSIPAAHAQTLDPDAKFRLAQGFEQAGEFERAAELYRELLHKDPGNFVCFDGLQRMYVQLKRYDDAIAVINDRIVRQPNEATLYGTLGTVHYRVGREPRQWRRGNAQ